MKWESCAAALAVTLAACSNQTLYTAVQDAQKVDCQQYPDTRYEECLAQLDTAYEDYEAARQDLAKERKQD